MGFRWLVLFLVAFPAVALAEVTPVTEDRTVTPVTEDRIVVTGGFGAGGTVTTEASNTGVTYRDSSPGRAGGAAVLQYDWAVAKYFVLGGRFGATRYDWSADRTNMRTWLDFDAVPMLTFGIDAGSIVVEPRVGALLGMSLDIRNLNDSPFIYNERIPRTTAGWNFGGLAGAVIRAKRGNAFVRHLGGVIEVGYIQRRAYGNGDIATHVEIRHSQAFVQLGVALLLK